MRQLQRSTMTFDGVDDGIVIYSITRYMYFNFISSWSIPEYDFGAGCFRFELSGVLVQFRGPWLDTR